MKNNKDESLVKFQELLKTLFQFETSDLDFGIYRILNYKRDLVEKFINDDLTKEVDEAFSKYQEKISKKIDEELEQKKQEVIKTLGVNALTTTGDIKEQFKDFPVAKEYCKLKEYKDELQTIDDVKLQVYNDLYNFFSRYYEDGDFVPHYRYSIKSHKYAIPYNGEEVKLYWANYDQYYIKTGELFRDYTFNIPNSKHKCVFRVVRAKEEVGNNKATKERFFVLDDNNPVQIDEKEIVIRFQYRELTEKEIKHHDVAGGSNTAKQEKINAKLYDTIVNSISGTKDNIKNALQSKNNYSAPLLLYQLNRFTRKNTSDYFIHKNLKKFLTEQLDYFIKSEVLSIETLEEEKNIDKHITRAKVVKEIGEDIIDFLAQIEDFQKRLWEKKKFVISTEYVITTDRVPSNFYDEIWNNQEQRKEWEDFGFDIPKEKEELSQKKLPIDTKYFSQSFKEQLLEELTKDASLDDLLDGVLIKSENWQALNLLSEKYREKVQTIYIDPPFNTGSDFLYKDRFRNSTWLELIKDRIALVNFFLKKEGAFYIHLDENANYYGRILLQSLEFDNIQEIVFNTNATKDEEADLFGYKSFGNRFVLKHSTIFYCFNDGCFFTKLWKPNRNNTNLNIGWLDLISKPKVEQPQKIEDFDFFIEKYSETGKLELVKVNVDEKIFPLGDLWTDIYSFTQSEMRVSENISFLTQKPENLIRRILQTSSKPFDLVMDYFAGSGTTLAVAHKLKRKWIGIEMSDCFNEYYIERGVKKLGLLGRIKNVFYGDKIFKAVDKRRKSHLSCDINWQGGGFSKYQVLEQYEDSLDNIELKENPKVKERFKDEYLLKYFLNFETRESPYLLNIDMLKNPFTYKLKVNLSEVGEPIEAVIDLPETFVYLLGLKVDKIKTRTDNGRKYLFILGEKDSQSYAVVFRDYSDEWTEDDLLKDKQFIKQELEPWQPGIVYVNGQCTLTSDFNSAQIEIRNIEDSFKKLMEGGLV